MSAAPKEPFDLRKAAEGSPFRANKTRNVFAPIKPRKDMGNPAGEMAAPAPDCAISCRDDLDGCAVIRKQLRRSGGKLTAAAEEIAKFLTSGVVLNRLRKSPKA